MSAGIVSAVSFAPESTWGTAVTPTKTLAVHTGAGLVVATNPTFPTGLKGSLNRNNQGVLPGAAAYDGEYEVDLIAGFAGYLFKSAIGSATSALKAGESTVYEHTFNEAATKPSLTVEEAISEVVRRFAGVIATGFTINVSTGNPVTATFPVMAKSQASATAITPVGETGQVLNFLGATLKLGGTTFGQADNLTLEYSNALAMRHTLNGSANPGFVNAGASECKGSFELYLDATSAAKYTDYLNGTTQSLQLTLVGPAIGTASNAGYDLTLPLVAFTASNVALRDDYNVVTVDFEGIQDPATGKLISAFKQTSLQANVT